MKKKCILIVEDHPLLRAGLRILLSQEAGIEIAGEADNGLDAIRLVETLNPDLVLMDLSIHDMSGFEAIADIKQRYPDTRVLVLTVHNEDEYVQESLRAGADGYILKDGTHDELCTAIRTVLSGKTYLGSGISARAAYLDTTNLLDFCEGLNIHTA